jgi:hypothetical protein
VPLSCLRILDGWTGAGVWMSAICYDPTKRFELASQPLTDGSIWLLDYD